MNSAQVNIYFLFASEISINHIRIKSMCARMHFLKALFVQATAHQRIRNQASNHELLRSHHRSWGDGGLRICARARTINHIGLHEIIWWTYNRNKNMSRDISLFFRFFFSFFFFCLLHTHRFIHNGFTSARPYKKIHALIDNRWWLITDRSDGMKPKATHMICDWFHWSTTQHSTTVHAINPMCIRKI